MFKINTKTYYVLIAISGIILFSIVMFLNKKNKINPLIKNKPLSTFSTPTPVVIIPTKSPQIIYITPTFTGANEEIPKYLLDLAIQKQQLKKKVPLNENEFIISYDYKSDKFIVTFKQATSNKLEIFNNWHTTNYSIIPLNKFLIQ